MAKSPKMPTTLFIYECEECRGEPIYAVAADISEISEEYDGHAVGIYELVEPPSRLKVSRELV